MSRGETPPFDAVAPQLAHMLRQMPRSADVVELLGRLLDNLPVGVALLTPDVDFTFLYCNPPFERWSGPEFLPVVGKPFAVAFPRVLRNRVIDVLKEVVRSKQPHHFRDYHYSGYHGDGPTLPGNVTVWNWDIYPLLDDCGEVSHLLSTGIDVTAPAVARHRLEEAHERGLEAIVEVARLVAGRADLPEFFGRLSATVAQLVGARRAMFLRLEGGELVGQPDAYGITSDVVEQIHLACHPGRHGMVERIVFDGEVFRARLEERGADIEPYRETIDRLARGDALMVSWRAADEPLGALLAADSTDAEGFTEEDVWVLRSAAYAAALVWQQKLAQAREAASLAEERRRVHELTLLQEAAHTLSGTLDLDGVLAAVVRSAALIVSPPETPNRRAAILRLVDDELVVDAEFDDRGEIHRGAAFPHARYPTLRSMLDTGRAGLLDVTKVGDDARTREGMRKAEVSALAVAPLRVGAELFGAILVSSPDGSGFGATELGRLDAIASLANLAIANATAYAKQQAMVGRLGALMRANLALTQESDPTLLLRALLESARDLAGADYAALEVRSADGTAREAFLHTGSPGDEAEASGEPPSGAGVLSVPMTFQDRLIGSIYVSGKRGASFTAEDELIITGLAAQAAVSVVNARLYQRLVENAATDPLTALYNRREFERQLANLPRRGFAVLAIDVDNLKPVNDEYGHEAGDAVLRAVASGMDGLRRSGDVLARVGGDEFAALLLDTDADGALQVAERMRVVMHGIALGQGQARISIGVASGEEGADPLLVWRAADEALFRAKRHGRDRVEGTRSDPLEGVTDALDRSAAIAHPAQWAATLDTVLAERAIVAVYQPIVRLDDGGVAGYEALARPSGTAPTASVEGLFAAAHRLGMIRDLDWLSRRAAVATARLLPQGLPVFINVSAAALLDPVHGVDQMLLLLTWAGWSAGDVVLEITERETINDLARLRHVLAAYREHGFRIALDDVGEGHSTLEVLATALPEYIKIARSLTMSSDRPGPMAAVQAAVAFARSTGTTVIAEGVETEAAARAMQALGVELGQGWHLAPPAPATDLARPRVVRTTRSS
ncbi:MAG TPA: EAL domain-containing protein [Candidatus Angelobacter sp.]|nr:EAL domain-containing protein [Candidatus Angelobacter sp.]